MEQVTIKDIYTGKPDAKDEIKFDGIEGFVKSYILPESFNIDRFLTGDACFITGFKGTGKNCAFVLFGLLIKR